MNKARSVRILAGTIFWLSASNLFAQSSNGTCAAPPADVLAGCWPSVSATTSSQSDCSQAMQLHQSAQALAADPASASSAASVDASSQSLAVACFWELSRSGGNTPACLAPEMTSCGIPIESTNGRQAVTPSPAVVASKAMPSQAAVAREFSPRPAASPSPNRPSAGSSATPPQAPTSPSDPYASLSTTTPADPILSALTQVALQFVASGLAMLFAGMAETLSNPTAGKSLMTIGLMLVAIGMALLALIQKLNSSSQSDASSAAPAKTSGTTH